jgi:hypothetical protein
MWLIAQTPIKVGSADGSARRIEIGGIFEVGADESAELIRLSAAAETAAPVVEAAEPKKK